MEETLPESDTYTGLRFPGDVSTEPHKLPERKSPFWSQENIKKKKKTQLNQNNYFLQFFLLLFQTPKVGTSGEGDGTRKILERMNTFPSPGLENAPLHPTLMLNW